MHNTDVLVIGGGNAAFTAALAAAERGRSVTLWEKAPREGFGGNSLFTAGATRIPHAGTEDLLAFVEPDERHARTEVPPYTEREYRADLERVSEGRGDAELHRVLAEHSYDTLRWLNDRGLRYRLMYERQAYETPEGGYLFWGGLHIGNVGGGEGLMADHLRAAGEAGIDVRFGHAAERLIVEDGRVVGAAGTGPEGAAIRARAGAVILASGGFEASAELRERHLGAGWGNARVRGVPGNTGEMLLAALEIGAQRGGDWGSCHSVAWDALVPENEGNFALTNRLTRGGYPLGIVVNRAGERFVDEGADFRNYTYARYGRDILAQPGSIAYQVFDARTRPMLRAEEYEMPGVSVFRADSLEELARMAGIEGDLAGTVAAYNASIESGAAFDPTVKDGRRADLPLPKSNWALEIESAPFYAFPVTCGITFTFGGLLTDTHGRALDAGGAPIPGLLACGEALGGLFSGNYPGGSGLAAGAVFGRRAGYAAAEGDTAPAPDPAGETVTGVASS